MTYLITISDGSRQIQLADASVDTTSTSLTLFGRDFAGYGQSMATDMVHMLENFSSSNAPSNTLVGQLWYDKANSVLNVCTQISPSIVWTPITPTSVLGNTGDVSLAKLVTGGVAPLASPALTGIPTSTTPDGTHSSQIATVGWAGTTFAPLASPALTGIPTAPAPDGTHSTQIATVGWVNGIGYAPLASPALSGIPTSTTPDGTHSSQIATVGYLQSQVSNLHARIRLQSDVTYYVSTSGSDNNDGTTSGTAWATLNHAWYWIQNNLDLNQHFITISLGSGTYAPLYMAGKLVGQNAATQFLVTGTGPSTVIAGTSSTLPAAVSVDNGAFCVLQNLTVTHSGTNTGNYTTSGIGLAAFHSGILAINNITFGTCGLYQMYANTGGSIFSPSAGLTFAITGNARTFALADVGGLISLTGSTLVIGTVTYTGSFVTAVQGGRVDCIAATFSPPSSAGNVTGKRYFADVFGIINVGGGGSTYFPGSISGSVGDNAPAYYG